QVTLITEKLPSPLTDTALRGAWDLLRRVHLGNRWMREQVEAGLTAPDITTEWETPLHVCDGVRALDRYLKRLGSGDSTKPAEQIYSFLSEFSHPNMGALFQHYQYEVTHGGRPRIHFGRKTAHE